MMLKTYLYLPQKLNEEITTLAEENDASKAETLRNVLEEGIRQITAKKPSSAALFLKLSEIGERCEAKGPRDLSQRMDEYLWNSHE